MEFPSLIKEPILKELEDFEHAYACSIQTDSLIMKDVVDFILSRKGKMMRPIVVLLFSRLYGTVNDKSIHSAVALELLHTASLLHDDVVDESLQRRSASSINAVWGNKVAILCGDYILATALKEIGGVGIKEVSDSFSELGRTLAKGELLQLSNLDSRTFSESVYYDVIRSKTSALFATCAEAGVCCVRPIETDDSCIRSARKFGELLGLCFQIRDDIFDYYKSSQVGKPVGNDMREGKLTLPILYVLNTKPDEDHIQLAHKIRALEASHEEIEEMISYAKNFGGIEYAQQCMNKLVMEARLLIPENAPKDVANALSLLLDYTISRDK